MAGMKGSEAERAQTQHATHNNTQPQHQTLNIKNQLYGYFGGLHRYGGMATTVLDTSNAFLHLAKAAHAPQLPQLARVSDALFRLFALAFLIGGAAFVCRRCLPLRKACCCLLPLPTRLSVCLVVNNLTPSLLATHANSPSPHTNTVRVLLPPPSMLIPGIRYGRVLPVHTYLITNALMWSVYAMQLMW